MQRYTLSVPFLCFLALLAPCMSSAQTRPKYTLVDGHFHYLNFVQETAGMDALFKAMDETGVAETMISGMPVVKKWEDEDEKRPTYYLDNDSRTYWYSATDFLVANAVSALSAERRKRVHPFICGINSSDRNAAEHVERMLNLYPGMWEGIGEVFARHDDLTALTYGETSRADNKAFDRLLDTAAKHNLPVIIHSDIGPAYLERSDFLGEIESAVKKHPHTRIVWAHAGISRRIIIPHHTDILRRMLQTYPNLRVDISWVIFEQEIAPGGVLSKEWVQLLDELPNRFIIGSDVVGVFDKYQESLQRYYLLLDAVKPETAKRVAHDNFLSLLPSHNVN